MEKWLKRNLSLSVALAVMATATVSLANTQNEEEEDSVFVWGPWGTVQTAAGPGSPVAPLVISFADGRNITDSSSFVPGIDTPDGDGSVYREYMAWYSKDSHDGRKFERAYFESLEAGVDGPEGRPTFDFTVATEAGEQTYSPEMLLVGKSGLRGAGAGYSAEESRFGDRYGHKNRWQNKYTESESFEYSSVFNQLDEDREYTEDDVAYINGQWVDKEKVKKYYRNKPSWIPSWNTNNDIGFFVTGNTSTLASINQLIAGNVEARYSGSFLTTHNNAGRVNLTIDFGNNSWAGSFVTPTSSRGHDIAFSVDDGAINGVDLSGVVDHDNQFNKGFFRYDQSVTGQVDASFFGDKAQHVNGITDIDASTVKTGRITGKNYGTTSDSYVGVFTTESQPEFNDR